jgi:hypothetical protein
MKRNLKSFLGFKRWANRYFVLDDHKIASYKGKGVFGKGLQHYASDIRKVEVLNEHEFKITFGAQITLELKAPDPKALKTWVACLKKKATEACDTDLSLSHYFRCTRNLA